ncbi:carbohydrate deacetylase-like [Lingula anatina]|uniref:Carbohydrate deacetylase n=1 Tax=Lingula anatina TaxID=7574 RepID=A0A1S3IH45_LINAN|nr:carbohydrate deacetylase [Lingula anatina]XP_013394035.1 carbohydrate deacetylase [Lingula anatina]XP_013397575.1 carbohydrate deacetylase-like [Lingula anatina]XP_013397585.1 carbohydrate deacetylase-like [Lingula anatina]|eukprot:XP_013394034.1 carbohydrate deacetylase [Lingula anatina]
MKKHLIINADDFGYCEERNKGIVECYKAGAVTSTTLMVSGQAAQQAAELISEYNIPVGLHFNITEGQPVCQSFQNSGCTFTDANGWKLGKMGFREALQAQKVDMKEVKLELESQLEKFQSLCGQLPHHVDGHQHVHTLDGVRKVFAEVLSSHNISCTRLPVEDLSAPWLNSDWKQFLTSVVNSAVETKELFYQNGIRSTDYFLGMTTMGNEMTEERIQSALKAIFSPDNNINKNKSLVSCELMVHPGYPNLDPQGGCGEGPDDFAKSTDRLHEVQVLTSPAMRQFYKEQGIELISFQDL